MTEAITDLGEVYIPSWDAVEVTYPAHHGVAALVVLLVPDDSSGKEQGAQDPQDGGPDRVVLDDLHVVHAVLSFCWLISVGWWYDVDHVWVTEDPDSHLVAPVNRV